MLSELERYEEAADAYREFNRRYDNFFGRYNLALILKRLEQWDEALAVLSEAQKIDPDDTNVHSQMRYVLDKKGEQGPLSKSEQQLAIELRNSRAPTGWETRIKKYRAQLVINRRDIPSRIGLANALLIQNSQLVEGTEQNAQISEAAEQFKIVLKIEPNHPKAHHGLANCYERLGNLDAAIREYRIAVDLAPEIALHRQGLGAALHHKAVGSPGGSRMRLIEILARENIDEELLKTAVAEYRTALKLDPVDESVFLPLAAALELLGQEEEADKLHEKIGRRSKAVRTALALRREDKIDEAIALLELAVEDDPHDTGAISSLGLAYVQQKRYEEALTVYQRLFKVDEPPSWYYFGITRTMCFLHRYEEAYQLLTEALKANPSLAEDYSFLSALGYVCLQQGKLEDALRHYRKARDLPGYRHSVLTANLGIAWVFMQQGKLDEAVTAIEEIADERRPPFNPLAVAEGANAWCELYRYDQTGEPAHLDKAMQHAQAGLEHSQQLRFDFGTRAECNLSLGICHYRQGSFPQALESLEKSYEEVEYDPQTWVFLATTHWKLGNKEEARQWKQKVDEYVKDHKPLPILKRYSDEATGLIR